MIIRIIDIILSLFGIIILLPLFIVISILIIFSDGGKIFFVQERIGKDRKPFMLLKFRSMKSGSDKNGLLTIGSNDMRITTIGRFIRKFKIDELPQLINILKGEMSFVGPRPEVRKYVDLYNQNQLRVLTVKPGLTDFASLEYFNENELLSTSTQPEALYINEIMPKKIELNTIFINQRSVKLYFVILYKTFLKLLK